MPIISRTIDWVAILTLITFRVYVNEWVFCACTSTSFRFQYNAIWATWHRDKIHLCLQQCLRVSGLRKTWYTFLSFSLLFYHEYEAPELGMRKRKYKTNKNVRSNASDVTKLVDMKSMPPEGAASESNRLRASEEVTTTLQHVAMPSQKRSSNMKNAPIKCHHLRPIRHVTRQRVTSREVVTDNVITRWSLSEYGS